MGDADCPSQEMLSGYVDGNIPLRQRAYLESHMAWCTSCRSIVGMITRSKTFVPEMAN
jgi:anti-sigma factor RsiW